MPHNAAYWQLPSARLSEPYCPARQDLAEICDALGRPEKAQTLRRTQVTIKVLPESFAKGAWTRPAPRGRYRNPSIRIRSPPLYSTHEMNPHRRSRDTANPNPIRGRMGASERIR